MNIVNKYSKLILFSLLLIFIVFALFYVQKVRVNAYNEGYNDGYRIGYEDGYEDRNSVPNSVQTVTETKVVYTEKPYDGKNDVVIHTDKPVVTIDVNGKQQQIVQTDTTADIGVQTTVTTKLRLPEKKWAIGLGIDNNKKVAYMLKSPLKVGKNSDNLGLWIAGSGRDKVMGGVSISF